jgi:hypothetical protein
VELARAIEPTRRTLQDASVADDQRPAALVDVRMSERFQDDFRTDSSRVSHRDRQEGPHRIRHIGSTLILR